jgi:putative ABC transport system permease protein
VKEAIQGKSSIDRIVIADRPLWLLTWRRIRKNALQYLLFILGVALGVAMMVSIDLANGSAQRAFELSTDAITGHTTHRLVSISPTGVDENLYVKLKRDLANITVAPIVEGYVNAKQLGSQPLRLVGVDLFAEPPFRNYFSDNDSTGSFEGGTTFLTQPNTVILSQDLADRYHVATGDNLTLDLAGKDLNVRVVGLVNPANNLTRSALSSILFTDIASAQEILGTVGNLSYIDLILDNREEEAAIAKILPTEIKLETAEAQKNAVQQMTAAFELNLTALSLLALVVGMFLIYNTVTFSVIQRRPLFGVLRCLGVTPGQLFSLILGESTILSLVGSLIGLGLGIVLGRAIVGLITQSINDFYFVVNVRDVSISTFSLVKGLIIGVFASLIASVIPAIEAMRTSPQTTLQRSSLESKVRSLLPWLVLAWAVFSILGVGLLRVDGGGLILAFAGLFSILLAAAFLTPPVTAFLMESLTSISNLFFGIVGRLAMRDIVRSLSRTSVAIAALMVAVSVIVGVSIMVGSFRGTVITWLDQTLQADIYVTPPSTTANRILGKLTPEVVSQMKQWRDWDDFVTYNETETKVKEFDRPVQLISADGDVSHGKRPYSWKRDKNIDPWQNLSAGKGVIVSEALLLRSNITEPPEQITIETPVGWRSFPILAVFYDYSNDRGTIILDNDIYVDLWKDEGIASVGLFLKPGESVEELAQALPEYFQDKQSLLVQSNQSLRNGSLEIFDRTFAITDALRLLAVVVAFIGVLSALMSLQLESTRETGILRANGMTPAQLWMTTFIKTGLMGAIAGGLAMPLGYVLAWILIYVINVRSFGWTLQMQLQSGYFLQAFTVAVVAAILAGIYPAWRLGNTVIAEAVRQE